MQEEKNEKFKHFHRFKSSFGMMYLGLAKTYLN